MKRIGLMLFLVFGFLGINDFLRAAVPNQINQGKEFFRRLYAKQEAAVPVNLKSVIDIMHYLYSNVPAKNQGKGFLSGNIILEDPDYKLFKFLRRYVEHKFPGDICKEVFIAKCSAYPRMSSHFNDYYVYTKKATKSWMGGITKTSCDYIHYGIDVIDGLQLPIKEKNHILFGKIGIINGKQMIFVKFEEAGLRGMEIIKHIFNLIKKYFSEKNNNSPTDYRREDIPKDVMKEFTNLINSAQIKLSKKERQEVLESVKAFGISKMITFARLHTAFVQMNTFADKLQRRYPDWRYRFGNEIILMHKELV